jgi:hypothetical protein
VKGCFRPGVPRGWECGSPGRPGPRAHTGPGLDSAERAAYAVERLAGRLRGWVTSVAGGEDRGEVVRSQGEYGRDDERRVEELVDDFVVECRKVLHPGESEGFS